VDYLAVVLEQARRMGDDERDRGCKLAETMDKVRQENRNLFRQGNQARNHIVDLQQRVESLRTDVLGLEAALENSRTELASAQSRNVLLSERQRRAKLALEETLRVVLQVETRLRGVQLSIHNYVDLIRTSNLVEIWSAYHKELYPQDRVDPAKYRGFTGAVQSDIKGHTMTAARGFNSGIAAENKTLNGFAKLLRKTINGM
jgi:hypothetical protein